MGDFNALANPSIDKHSPKLNNKHKSTKPTSTLIQNIINYNFIDNFRELNPFLKKFTWQNSKHTLSRIDYIWISLNNNWNILDANIHTSNLITNSDHAIVTSEIDVNNILTHNPNPRHTITQKIFDTSHTSHKQWQQFKDALDSEIEKSNLIPLAINHNPLIPLGTPSSTNSSNQYTPTSTKPKKTPNNLPKNQNIPNH